MLETGIKVVDLIAPFAREEKLSLVELELAKQLLSKS
jgi:hypothetical protein